MKRGTVAFVGVFCIAILVVSAANAGKPPRYECILFTGDLESAGNTLIDGCCPNAGPAPEYDMILHNISYFSEVTGETHLPEIPLEGYVFMNVLGTPGPDQRYMVKFWTWDYPAGDPAFGDYFIEIRGGVLGGKKDVPNTVTFTNQTATLWVYYDRNYSCDFSDYFSDDPTCNPCFDVEPGCNPLSDDPNCYDPCNEEFSIDNVSFVLIRDSDLSYCSDSGNIPPIASFTSNCSDLTCNFTDTSTDSDGSVVDWIWDFGDGGTSTEQNPIHSYAGAGTNTVTLTVTDDGDATDDTDQPVTVTEPNTGITLTATGYRVRSLQKADLEWSGATGADVDVYRDGMVITTTANDGAYTDDIDRRGGGSYAYQVCEAGAGTCSNVVTVDF
jgi:PKD repeat protein